MAGTRSSRGNVLVSRTEIRRNESVLSSRSAVEGLMTVMGRDKAEIKPGTPRKESESLR